MSFLNRMEKKFGKWAIPNLPLIMIILEVIGYTLSALMPKVLNYLCFDPGSICRGQVWRLITWVLMPPSSLNIFTVIMLFFYYWIARTLASTWGDFYFNVYVLGGILVTDLGMMLAYPVFLSMSSAASGINIMLMPSYVTLYYIQTTILLAFAFTYPDAQVLLYFFIPIKMSWLGIFEGIMLVYDFIRVKMAAPRIVILLAVLNFILYFLMTKDLRRFHPKEFARRANYRKATGQSRGFFDGLRGVGKNQGSGQGGSWNQNQGSGQGGGWNQNQGSGQGGSWNSGQGAGRNEGAKGGRSWQPGGANGQGRPAASTSRRSAAGYTKIYPNGARHKCAICGRTELDDDSLEFRYCSKCEGSYEYCQDHLFTHQHIKNGVPGGGQT